MIEIIEEIPEEIVIGTREYTIDSSNLWNNYYVKSYDSEYYDKTNTCVTSVRNDVIKVIPKDEDLLIEVLNRDLNSDTIGSEFKVSDLLYKYFLDEVPIYVYLENVHSINNNEYVVLKIIVGEDCDYCFHINTLKRGSDPNFMSYCIREELLKGIIDATNCNSVNCSVPDILKNKINEIKKGINIVKKYS